MKEMWDLYDKNRNILDRKVERGTKLSDDEYHLVTNAWIKNSKNEFLISRRSINKKNPLMWECTGGSVLMGENTYQGAIREVKEELGIDISLAPYTFIGSVTRYFKDCPDIVDVYIFDFDTELENIIKQDEEVSDVKWMTKEEVLDIYNNGNLETISLLMEVLNYEN